MKIVSATDQGAALLRTLDMHADSRLNQVYTALPGRVERYDPTTQLADVQPSVGSLWVDRDDQATPYARALPKLSGVPVIFTRGGTGRITVPIQAGDHVLLLMSTWAYTYWFVTGVENAPQEDHRTHQLGECFALPGLFNSKSVLDGVPDNAIDIGGDVGEMAIQVELGDSGNIKLGRSAEHFVALSNRTEDAVNTVIARISVAIGVTAAAATATGVAPVTGTALGGFLSALKSAIGGIAIESTAADRTKAL